MPSCRKEVADKAYQDRLRTIDPIWNQKYDTKPPGAVPDFDQLHAHWDMEAARRRAFIRRHITTPKVRSEGASSSCHPS